MAALNHPNIVAIYEVGEHEGQHYFAMQLVDGSDLARYLDGKPMVPRTAAELLVTVAEAIQYAHDHAVLHRDLKPGNILLDTQGRPHVTDFGIAKLVERTDGLTASLTMLGTPGYMAPEQAAGRAHQVTTAADTYSLGALLYHLLTGRPPFKGETPLETLDRVLHQEPVPPRAINPAVARDLETICLKCLEKAPKRRYISAHELGVDLKHWLHGEPINARPVSVVEHALKWVRRKPAMAALILVLLLAIGGFAVQDQINRQKLGQEKKAALGEAKRADEQRQVAEEQRRVSERTLDRLEMGKVEASIASDDVSAAIGQLVHLLRRNPSNDVAVQRLASSLTYRNFALPLKEHDSRETFGRAQFDVTGTRLVVVSRGNGSNWVVTASDCDSGLPIGNSITHRGVRWMPVISPGGDRVVLGFDECSAAVLDTESGAVSSESQFPEEILNADFSTDGRHIVLESTNYVWIVDAKTAQLVTKPLNLDAALVGVDINLKEQRIITTTVPASRLRSFGRYRVNADDVVDSTVEIWNGETGEPACRPIRFASGRVEVRQHEDSRRFVTIFTENRKQPAKPDGVVPAIWVSTKVQIWDVKDGTPLSPEIHHLQGQKAAGVFEPWPPRISSNGRRLAVSDEPDNISIWDVESGKRSGIALRHPGVKSAQFSADSERIVTYSQVRPRVERTRLEYDKRQSSSGLNQYYSGPISKF